MSAVKAAMTQFGSGGYSPLMIQKAISDPSFVETGHSASMLRPFNVKEPAKVLSAPSRSLRNPEPILPTAEEKLNAATSAAAVPEESSMDVAYRGRKKGGTRSGKVATAPAS